MGGKTTAISNADVSTDVRENIFIIYSDVEVCAAYEIKMGKEPGLRNTEV